MRGEKEREGRNSSIAPAVVRLRVKSPWENIMWGIFRENSCHGRDKAVKRS